MQNFKKMKLIFFVMLLLIAMSSSAQVICLSEHDLDSATDESYELFKMYSKESREYYKILQDTSIQEIRGELQLQEFKSSQSAREWYGKWKLLSEMRLELRRRKQYNIK